MEFHISNKIDYISNKVPADLWISSISTIKATIIGIFRTLLKILLRTAIGKCIEIEFINANEYCD